MSSILTYTREVITSIYQSVGNKKVLLSLLLSVIGSAILLQLGYFVIVKEMLIVDNRHSHFIAVSGSGEPEDWEPANATGVRVLTSYQLKYGVQLSPKEGAINKKFVVNYLDPDSHTEDSYKNSKEQVITPLRTKRLSKLDLLMSFKSRIDNQIKNSMETNSIVKSTEVNHFSKTQQIEVSISSKVVNQPELSVATDVEVPKSEGNVSPTKFTMWSSAVETPQSKVEASPTENNLREREIDIQVNGVEMLPEEVTVTSDQVKVTTYLNEVTTVCNSCKIEQQNLESTTKPDPTLDSEEDSASWTSFRRVLKTFLGHDKSSTIKPTRSVFVDLESVAVEEHRKQWRSRNSGDLCEEWRMERQNWTAFVTGRTINSSNSDCSSPYEDASIKRIVFRNFTEEFTGCTRHTPRCKERPHYDHTHNLRINVPPCCRKHLIETYRDIEFELTRLDVKHYMIGGAVIGWMRNGRMIPYDDDLDVLVPMPFWKTDKFWEFVSRMRIKYHHPCRLVEATKMKIYYSAANDINIDMWPYEIIKPIIHRRRSAPFRRKHRKKYRYGNRPSTLDVTDNRTRRKGVKKRRKGKRKKRTKMREIESNEIPRLPRRAAREKRSNDLGPEDSYIDIPYYKFKRQPVANLLPPQQVVFENFLVYFPNKPEAYLNTQYGEGNWVNELTCKEVDSDNTCIE